MVPAPKPVEKVDAASGAVVATFPNVDAAAQEAGANSKTLRSRILSGSQKDGHSWRFAAEVVAWKVKAVEKVDAASGAVVATFPSVEAAAQEAGAKTNTLRARISNGTEKEGHSWRLAAQGVAVSKPVEKVEAASGTVVATFPSVEAAAQEAGTKSATLRSRMSRGSAVETHIWRFAVGPGASSEGNAQPPPEGNAKAVSAAPAPPNKKRRASKGGSFDDDLPSGGGEGQKADLLSGLDAFQLTAAADEAVGRGEKRKAAAPPAPVAHDRRRPCLPEGRGGATAAAAGGEAEAASARSAAGGAGQPGSGAGSFSSAKAAAAGSPLSAAKLPQPPPAAAGPAGGCSAQTYPTFASALESLNTLKFAGGLARATRMPGAAAVPM